MKTWNNAGRPTSCLSRMTHPDYPLHENLRELFAITLPLVHRFFEEDSKVIAAVAAVEKLEMHSLPSPPPTYVRRRDAEGEVVSRRVLREGQGRAREGREVGSERGETRAVKMNR